MTVMDFYGSGNGLLEVLPRYARGGTKECHEDNQSV